MAKTDLTAARLRELLDYNPDTGIFTNRAPRKKIRVGEVAGSFDRSHGYIVLSVDCQKHYGHRLAFLYMTGRWPEFVVDHMNGNRSDNRWSNLRDATRLVNQQNMRSASTASSSGLLGAFKKRAKWTSNIRFKGGLVRLGSFNTASEAHAAYVAAKRKLHEGCTI